MRLLTLFSYLIHSKQVLQETYLFLKVLLIYLIQLKRFETKFQIRKRLEILKKKKYTLIENGNKTNLEYFSLKSSW